MKTQHSDEERDDVDTQAQWPSCDKQGRCKNLKAPPCYPPTHPPTHQPTLPPPTLHCSVVQNLQCCTILPMQCNATPFNAKIQMHLLNLLAQCSGLKENETILQGLCIQLNRIARWFFYLLRQGRSECSGFASLMLEFT